MSSSPVQVIYILDDALPAGYNLEPTTIVQDAPSSPLQLPGTIQPANGGPPTPVPSLLPSPTTTRVKFKKAGTGPTNGTCRKSTAHSIRTLHMAPTSLQRTTKPHRYAPAKE